MSKVEFCASNTIDKYYNINIIIIMEKIVISRIDNNNKKIIYIYLYIYNRYMYIYNRYMYIYNRYMYIYNRYMYIYNRYMYIYNRYMYIYNRYIYTYVLNHT